MRYTGLLIGTLAVTACSVDHVVVATLDEAGSANLGGMIASAGSSGKSESAAGNLSSGGYPAEGGNWFLIATGGSNVEVRIDGESDAGTKTEVLCSCKEDQATLCGSDGISYQYPASCEDGGTCQMPTIACWHACPCVDDGSTSGDLVTWFSEDCTMPTVRCTGEFVCLRFTNLTHDPPSCITAGN